MWRKSNHRQIYSVLGRADRYGPGCQWHVLVNVKTNKLVSEKNNNIQLHQCKNKQKNVMNSFQIQSHKGLNNGVNPFKFVGLTHLTNSLKASPVHSETTPITAAYTTHENVASIKHLSQFSLGKKQNKNTISKDPNQCNFGKLWQCSLKWLLHIWDEVKSISGYDWYL